MTFPIGTFSANDRPNNTNTFNVNGDVFSTSNVPPNLPAVNNSQYSSTTTSNATDSNAANQGIRETGIIEKLLVSSNSLVFVVICKAVNGFTGSRGRICSVHLYLESGANIAKE